MKRKCMIAAGIMALMMAAATGCGSSGREAERENTMLPLEDKLDEDNDAATGSPTPDISPENSGSGSRDIDIIFIGGKVRSTAQNSFVISRTLVEDSMVIMPEAGSPEEELVTVLCTDSTTFEHWTIRGGGAGIETKEAAFSDIQEGAGLEAEGYFDGEEFVAERVLIEVYE